MDDGGSSDWESAVRRWGRQQLSDSVNFCWLAIVQQYFINTKVFGGTFLCTVSAEELNKEPPNHLLLESLLRSMWRALSQPRHLFCWHCLWLFLQEPRGQCHPLHPSRRLCQDEEPAAAVSDCPALTPLGRRDPAGPGLSSSTGVTHITTHSFPPPLPPPLWGIFTHEELSLHVIVSEIRSSKQVLPAGLCLCNYSSPFRKSSPGPVSQHSCSQHHGFNSPWPMCSLAVPCLGFTHRTDTAVISTIWTASTCHSAFWCKNTDVLSELLLVLQAGTLHCYQTLFSVLPGFLFSSSP